MQNQISKEFIELYRFLAAICINLHVSAFKGLSRDDVWPEAQLPRIRRLWQMAEDVGGLWRNPEGENPKIIACNLREIEDYLKKLSVAHPGISFLENGFEMSCNVFHIDRDAYWPSIKLLGEYPDISTWEGMLTPVEYEAFLGCIAADGKWQKKLEPLIQIFCYARVKIMKYLPPGFLSR